MRGIIRFLARLSCLIPPIGRPLRRLLYRVEFPRAQWRFDEQCSRWIFTPSEVTGEKGYNCSEFVRSVIESPPAGGFNGKEPKWGPGSHELETPGVRAWLIASGYQTGSCRCGCCRGQRRDCVVVYVFPDDSTVDHVAIFDPVHCDWVAKRSATQPEKFIERMLDPIDYVNCRRMPDSRISVPTFYCKPGDPPARRDLPLLHAVARFVP